MGLFDRLANVYVNNVPSWAGGVSDQNADAIATENAADAARQRILERQRDQGLISAKEEAELTHAINEDYLDDWVEDHNDLLHVVAPELIPDKPKLNKWIFVVVVVGGIVLVFWLFAKWQKKVLKMNTRFARSFIKP